MVDSQKIYKDLDKAPKIFSYSHDIMYFTRIDKYGTTPIVASRLNETNPLNLTNTDSDFRIRIAPKDKSMKYNLNEILNTYDYYTYASPQVYINSPFEMYNKDSNSFFTNQANKIAYFVDIKLMCKFLML